MAPSPAGNRVLRCGHALVLGAGMAGLSAAAALAGRAERVTLLERDALSRVDEPRKGVPQGRHLHLLLPPGLQALERLFPGFADELRRSGGQLLDAPSDFSINVAGGRLAVDSLAEGFTLAGATRPLIEGMARERVRALPNVEVRAGCEALGLSAAAGGRRVIGARVRRAGSDGDGEDLAADLVVDATGRGSRAARWLEKLGYRSPREQRVRVDVRYTTRFFRRPQAGAAGPRVVMVGVPPGGRRGAVALAVEDGRWQVVLAGILGEQAGRELDGFRAYARSLWCPDVADLIDAAEPIGEAVTGAYPANTRHRYDRLRRFPEGFVVVGDALCPLNPLYAQGMTVATLEGLALGRALDAVGPKRVGKAFFRATRDLVSACWTQAVDNDLRHPSVEGPRTLRWRVLGAYGDRLLRAARHDPVVARAFFEVMSLVRPGTILVRPRILRRAFAPPALASVRAARLDRTSAAARPPEGAGPGAG